MKLQSPHFETVQSGLKKFELRLYDEKRQKIKKGDIIDIEHNDDPDNKYQVKVLSLARFKTFAEAMISIGIETILPGITLMEGLKVYSDIYPWANEKKYGVLALRIEKI